VFWAEKHSEKLGGPGNRLKSMEQKLANANNRGRLVKGHWIFGEYERESKKFFIIPVEDRTEETLLVCIKKWILPRTIIVSDCWKSYNCLNNKGFQHLTVNHSYNFVDPQTGKKNDYKMIIYYNFNAFYVLIIFKLTGAHTQHIERVSREVRGNIPRYGTREDHVLGNLAEYLFKRAYSRSKCIEIFFDIIAELYPPISFNERESSSEPEPSTSMKTRFLVECFFINVYIIATLITLNYTCLNTVVD